jgi:hypothetical protein
MVDEYTRRDMRAIAYRLEHEAGANGGDRAASHVFPTAYGPGGLTYGLQGSGQPDDVNGRTEALHMTRRRSIAAIRRDGVFADDPVGDGTNASSD